MSTRYLCALTCLAALAFTACATEQDPRQEDCLERLVRQANSLPYEDIGSGDIEWSGVKPVVDVNGGYMDKAVQVSFSTVGAKLNLNPKYKAIKKQGDDDVRKAYRLGGSDQNSEARTGAVRPGNCHDNTCVTNIRLDGTRFVGTRPDGTLAFGDDFRGAQFLGRLPGGEYLRVKIEEFVKATSGVPAVRVSYESGTGWVPYCGLDQEGNPKLAFPVRGGYDHRKGTRGGEWIDNSTSFTLACEGSPAFQCMEALYESGREVNDDSRYLEACVRVVRGDYCSDGVFWNGRESERPDMISDSADLRQDIAADHVKSIWDKLDMGCIYNRQYDAERPTCIGELLDCGEPRDVADDDLGTPDLGTMVEPLNIQPSRFIDRMDDSTAKKLGHYDGVHKG